MIWSTRTISTFVAATVPVEKKGDPNPLLQQAQQIGMTDSGTTDAPSTQEPTEGSFERFMSSFGNPQRWAGH